MNLEQFFKKFYFLSEDNKFCLIPWCDQITPMGQCIKCFSQKLQTVDKRSL